MVVGTRTFVHIMPAMADLVHRLIISCPHEPQSIIEHLEPYLGGSANIVVHAPSAQVSEAMSPAV